MITFNDLFEVSVKKFENNVAIIKFNNDSYETYTYKELQKATQILYENFQKVFKIGDIIGIYCTHNALIPVLINLIHKCGCSFVFFDINSDKITIEKVLNDMNINHIFAIDKCIEIDEYSTTDLSTFSEDFKCQLKLYSKADNKKDFQEYTKNDIAYLIKTSGSTGIAKYVLVSHDSIYPNVVDFENIFRMTSKDVIYFSTPLTFDPSVIEIYLSTKCGSSLLIAPPSLKLLFQKKYSITVWQTTPSLFLRFGAKEIENMVLSQNSSLRILALGGEPLYFDCNKFRNENNQTKIFSLYGITELSCWASVKEICYLNVIEKDKFDLGNILSETLIEIRDKNNKRVLNETGNIFIGSDTRICFVGSECLTIPKIITSFSDKQTRWYNSGDLGIEKNGIIYFNGRQDRLIKRFGHKINLLEVERVILDHNHVQQCICIWNMKNQFMIALYTSNENITSDIWKYLRVVLNIYSLPDYLLRVDILPMNNHGKISLSKSESLYENLFKSIDSNVNPISLFISLVSKYSLCDKNINNVINKSFIDIGGTSIQAVQLINEFEKITNKNIPDLYIKLLDKECSINSVVEFLQHNSDTIEKKENFSKNNIKRSIKYDINDSVKRSRSISKKFETIWKFNTGKCIDARPILCKNNNETFILIGSHSGIAAILDANSGKPHFTMNLNSRIEAPFYCFGSDLNMNAVVGCYDGSFWCFSIHQKKVVWKIMLNSMIKSQACHIDSYIFVGTYDSIIYMVDTNTGESLHSIQISDKGIAADLVCHEKTVFVGTLDGMCACALYDNRSLSILWKNKLKSPIFAKPSLLKNGSYILFSEVNKEIHCFCTKTGESIWIFDDIQGNLFSSCSVSTANDRDIIIFGCHDRHTYKLSCETPKTPTVDWRIQHLSEIYATPYVKDNLSVVSISTDGHLQMIGEDGEVLAEHRFPGEVFSSPIADNDLIYVGCRDDNIYCIKT